MAHLIQSMLICLLAALVLGFILGWLFKAMVARPMYPDRPYRSGVGLDSPEGSHAVASRVGMSGATGSPGSPGSRSSRAEQVQRDDFIFVDR